jgi:hypothetical protein
MRRVKRSLNNDLDLIPHSLCKQGVTGSIPITSTKSPRPAGEALLVSRLQSTLDLDNI